MDLEQEIKSHSARVEAGERVCYAKACLYCGADKAFQWHDRRPRRFRVVTGQCILVLLSWILRWRCLVCGKRFTDYPPFRLAP